MDNVDSNPINKTNINDDITLPNFINKCNNPKKNMEIQMKTRYFLKSNCQESNVIELLQVNVEED